jgi:magnesium-dependent phosphatase 1
MIGFRSLLTSLIFSRSFQKAVAFGLTRNKSWHRQHIHRSTSRSTMTKMNSASNRKMPSSIGKVSKTDMHLPTMIVFDLDDCLWTPEMYTLRSKPSIPVMGDLGLGNLEQGVVGLKCPHNGPTVRLFDGARKALRELATDPKYEGVVLGAASSSEEPTFSHACLENIEVLPGLTLRNMITYDQIGRTGPLSSRKTTHFSLLHEESQIPYEEMLFFDDCNWGDHVGDMKQSFGVEGQRTPSGMQYKEFHRGLDKYLKASEERAMAQK